MSASLLTRLRAAARVLRDGPLDVEALRAATHLTHNGCFSGTYLAVFRHGMDTAFDLVRDQLARGRGR